jgi:hypothetical protein
MPTAAAAARPRADDRFFLVSGWIMAATIVAGFSTNVLIGRSSFASPLVYHLHALAFFGWVAIYLAQTGLVAAGHLRLHRRLGWLAAGWLPVMAVMGLWLNVHSLRERGGTPPRPPSDFLFANATLLFGAIGLVLVGIAARRRTDWHRRLLFCALALMSSSAIGRMTPPSLNAATGGWLIVALLLLFPVSGMICDARRDGRVHRAWWLGVSVIVGSKLAGTLLAFSPWGLAFTEFVLAGSPGALASSAAISLAP